MTGQEEIESRAGVVRALLRTRIRDSHLAEDLCQEALLKCCRSLQAKGEIPSEAYVVRIALNVWRSWGRTREGRRRLQGLEVETRDKREKEPAMTLEEREQARAVASAFDTLPLRYRQPARLSLVEEWSNQRIAETMGLSVNTVKTRMRRARGMLQAKLKMLMQD